MIAVYNHDMPKRPPPNRSTDAAILIRCSRAEAEYLKCGARSLVVGIPGAKFSVTLFCLQAGMARTRMALGMSFEEWAKSREKKK